MERMLNFFLILSITSVTFALGKYLSIESPAANDISRSSADFLNSSDYSLSISMPASELVFISSVWSGTETIFSSTTSSRNALKPLFNVFLRVGTIN